MPIVNTDTLIESYQRQQIFAPVKYGVSSGSNTGYWNSSWRMNGSYLADIPTSGSGEQCNSSTEGRIPLSPATNGRQTYLQRFLFSPSLPVGCYLMDRLVHTSGLVGNITTVQTVDSVSIPTRGGNGHGVEIWLEWFTATGSSTSVVTVTYTNAEGVSGRVTTAPTLASMRATSAMRIPLAQGDTGVRSVESVKLSVTTGTAGNFGVTLAKRVVGVPNLVANSISGFGPISGGLPIIDNESCLYFVTNSSTTTSPSYDTELCFVES